jgi:hypothetical protein
MNVLLQSLGSKNMPTNQQDPSRARQKFIDVSGERIAFTFTVEE